MATQVRTPSRRSGKRAPAKPLLGSERPRLFTPPLRRLSRATSRGYEVIDFAEHVLGEPLLPWERWLAIHALELTPDGRPRFRVVIVLVARQNGKTHTNRVITLWRLFVDGARLVLGVGQDVSLAREVWNGCIESIHGVPVLAAELETIRRTNGDEWFRLASGARYKISAASRSAGRGLSVDHLNFEELREQRKWDAWGALSKTTMARPDAMTWCFSNAGDDESVVLNHLRESALAGRDPSIGLFEWSAADGCALDDRKAWAQANPGLGYVISEQAIASALATDPPAVFRTEVLCQRVDVLDSAISLGAWRDSTDPQGSLEPYRDKAVMCVDVAPDGAHVALVAAAPIEDGRVRVEVIRAWDSTDAARFELGDVLDRAKPRLEAWFPSGPAAALGPVLRARGAHEIKGAQVAEACQSFADLVAGRRVVHPGDPLLDAHVAGARRLDQGDGWRFVRRGAGHVDAAYAAAGAVHALLTVPEEKPLQKPWVV